MMRTDIFVHYDAEFKESGHPRDPQGEFSGGSHSSRLLGAGHNEKEFEVAFNHLKSSNLPLSELSRIASEYHNTPTGATHQYKFKNKNEAVAAIRSKFLTRANAEHANAELSQKMGRS